jgi:hypothetical protein
VDARDTDKARARDSSVTDGNPQYSRLSVNTQLVGGVVFKASPDLPAHKFANQP